MVADQIINKSIRSIFQRHIEGKKGQVFFRISTGEKDDPKPYPIHEKGLEYTGEEKFMEVLEEAYEEKPHYIGIELFNKAEKNLKKEPYTFKKAVISEQGQDLTNFEGLGSFGGLQGMIQAKISESILESQNKEYAQKVSELTAEKLRQERKIEELEQLISNLKESVKEKDWDIKYLKADHERDIYGIHSKNEKFEKLLTVGGVVAAKLAGLNETDLRGILEADHKQDSLETGSDDTDKSDIDFEENRSYEGQKKQAKQYADAVYSSLIQLIDRNSDENALNAMISIKSITDFILRDLTSLKSVIDFIVHKQNDTSAADHIIDQVNNYKTTE